jgi:excisionase family DNA binding protein
MRAMNEQGYSVRELATLTGIAAHTVRDWVQRGLLPHVKFAGPKTRYTEVHLLRIKKLKSESLSLDTISARLATMGPQELQNLLQPPPTAAPRVTEPSLPAESWKRVILCPGLELHVADTVMHKRMAQQVYMDFLARQTPERSG